MKLLSKEALLVGGIYGVLDTPFSLIHLEVARDMLFIAFIISLIMLSFNRVPKFISYIFEHFQKTSYYLCSIGWIPYFIIISFLGFITSNFIVTYSETATVSFIYGLAYISLFAAVVSVIIAYIKARK